MAKIPVDEVIAHLHGIGAKYVIEPPMRRVTGGGVSTLDITRTSDGYVSVTITFLFHVFEFKVPQQEWDRVMNVEAK